MFRTMVAFCICLPFVGVSAQDANTFVENNGLVVVEAEHFVSKEKTSVRDWLLCDASTATRDNLGNYSYTAGNKAYMEILPDTRRSADDPLLDGQNFSGTPGQMCVINYRVYFNTTGRYYVWSRVHSRNGEDNGVHVGINGTWPSTGARMQWCDGKNGWYWGSEQRTDAVHCGVSGLIYLEVQSVGLHTISFSMREDGFRHDRWLMTKTLNYSISGGRAAMGPTASARYEQTGIAPAQRSGRELLSATAGMQPKEVYSLNGKRIDMKATRAGNTANHRSLCLVRLSDGSMVKTMRAWGETR